MSPHADCHNSGGAKQMIQQKSTVQTLKNKKKDGFDFFVNVATPIPQPPHPRSIPSCK